MFPLALSCNLYLHFLFDLVLQCQVRPQPLLLDCHFLHVPCMGKGSSLVWPLYILVVGRLWRTCSRWKYRKGRMENIHDSPHDIEQGCLIIKRCISTSRRSSPFYLMLSTGWLIRGILIWGDIWQMWNSSSSYFWSTWFHCMAYAISIFRMEVSEDDKLTVCKYDSVDTAGECSGAILRSLGSMPQIQRSMDDVPKRYSIARISMILR